MQLDRIEWLSDLIHLEIVLWDRIDARLKQDHELPLAFFEALHAIDRAQTQSVRIGELAEAMRITVGGTSKLVDRVERAGLIRRELDAEDRRARGLTLTDAGKIKLASARATYEAEVAVVLDGALTPDEQQQMHGLVTRLLRASTSAS